MEVLAEAISDFVKDLDMTWEITSTFAKTTNFGVWVNFTLGSDEQTLKAFELIKKEKFKFRDVPVYASIHSVFDERTITFSTVK